MSSARLSILLYVVLGCLVACNGDQSAATDSGDMGISGSEMGVGPNADLLFPVRDLQDPLELLASARDLHDCQVWIDRFQPRDRVASERLVLTFDEASQWILEEIDVGLDRVADRRRSRVFDGMDQLSLLETDNDADGLPDQRIQYVWEAGRLIKEDHDQNADNVIEGRRRYRYTTSGLLVADEWIGLPQVEIQRRNSYEYD